MFTVNCKSMLLTNFSARSVRKVLRNRPPRRQASVMSWNESKVLMVSRSTHKLALQAPTALAVGIVSSQESSPMVGFHVDWNSHLSFMQACNAHYT